MFEPIPYTDDLFEKANYIGNKRRFASYIVNKFPEGVKTVFDAMTGCSAVLIEAARKGMRVRGNDLSPVAYWYSKGVFEGAALSEQDADRLLKSVPRSGWLTTKWEGKYPRKPEIRKFIDGLMVTAKTFQGAKRLTAQAVASRLLQTMYGESGSGFFTINWETIPDVQRILGKAINEVNKLIVEVGGKGTISAEDARTMTFPKSDVVYFDPPYFRKDKGALKYFQAYRIVNSILLQSEWRQKDINPDEMPGIISKLCQSGRHVIVSTAGDSAIPWTSELGKHKSAIRKFRLTYHQNSGLGGRDSEQHQNLLVAKTGEQARDEEPLGEVIKAEDTYLAVPAEGGSYRFVVQHHFIGKSVHADLRIEAGDKKLIGWTINSMIAGSLTEPVITLDQARRLPVGSYSKINWREGKLGKLATEPKESGTHAWLTLEGVIPKGETGASANNPAVILIADKGTIEYGAQKNGFHEYFLKSSNPKSPFNGRIVFVKMEGDAPWVVSRPEDETPYVVSDGAVKDGWIPGKGTSALPGALKARIPEAGRFWLKEDEKRIPGTFEYRRNLKSFEPRLTTLGQVSKVVVKGWDASKKQPIVAIATSDSVVERSVLGDQAGADFVKQEFGDDVKVLHDLQPASQKEAEELAKAFFRQKEYELIEAAGTCIGEPTLKAKSLVGIEGVGRKFSGTYYVTRVTHTFDDSGYLCDFECKRNAVTASAQGSRKSDEALAAAGYGTGA